MISGLPQAPTLVRPSPRRRRCACAVATRCSTRCSSTHVLKYGAWRYARSQPLGLHPGTLYKTIHEPYFFGYVDQQLVQHYGQRLVESGGLRVQTTIDPSCSGSPSTRSRSTCPHATIRRAHLSRSTLGTGRCARWRSGCPSRERLQFNLATQGHRQAGSAFKPFTLAAALEHGTSLYSYFNGPPAADDPRPALRGRLQPAVGRPQQRRRDGGNDEPDRRDRLLREHDLRAARLAGRPRRTSSAWPTGSGSSRT